MSCRKQQQNKTNFDNWTIDNKHNPENSLKRIIQNKTFNVDLKNSNNGIGKLVVFLTVIELELKAEWMALDIFYESLILAQDERWRRA